MALFGPAPLPDNVLALIEPLGDRDARETTAALQERCSSAELQVCARALRLVANGTKAAIAARIVAAGYGPKRPVVHLVDAGEQSRQDLRHGGDRPFIIPFDQFPANVIDFDGPFLDLAVRKADGTIVTDQLPAWAALSCGIYGDRPVPIAVVDRIKAMVFDVIGNNQGGSPASGAASSPAARFPPPAGGLNPLQLEPGSFASGVGGVYPASGPFHNDRDATALLLRQGGLLPAFSVSTPGQTGASNLAHPVISAFINSRQPIWDKCSNGNYVRTIELGLFHIKDASVYCADLVATMLQHCSGLSSSDKEKLEFCLEQQRSIYRQTNLLVYFPDVANDYNEDKSLAELGVAAKKLRKLSAKDTSATSFITGPAFAPAPPTITMPFMMGAQPPAAPQHYAPTGAFPAGSCPIHPLSTTHNVTTCREAKRKTSGGGGGGGGGASNGKTSAKPE